MIKCLLLFVEGDTEVEFYKQVVANARKLHPVGRFDTNIEYRNVRGVGGFKNIALRKFIKEIKPKYGDNCEYTVVLCSDTDVFDFAPKPPIRWNEIKKELDAATYRGARISVNIIPNDFPESMRHSWDSSEKRITAAIIKSIYVDADVNQIEYRDFLGLNCAHYGGITNKKCSDGHMLYMEQYIYCAPCCMVTFVATSEEYENYNIYRAFDNFTKI